MRKTFLVLTVALAAIGFSAVSASAKGKPSPTGANCKPAVAVILTGTLSADATAATLTMNVTGGNHAAAPWKTAKTAGVTLTATTKISRQGHHAATDLKSGDKVNVHARACKADLANAGAPALTATRVTAHPAA